ncbi:cobalamin biosynthesis protein [Paracoccus sp. P2]|uniref:Cobalamin biosynthesis protein n=1 Tax=Paracoccus pantotrophus TaxID=82367 RepID=A0A1I5E0K0_PARPN|nr:cobalamin biosynthesis protein [Paracoccus pantotrophus]MDF3853271.1 cobalamin biosynthesis protein [Paracoccus pantotrophus]QFG36828.1 precorrin methylase [Paracoccus pantotrophus]QLH14396.1 cobalamin biosynthesis protein [Paracoccus pantotrophus]RDD96110.1 precorrin methylase [Paracoccus pantotrophus]RKS52766.1 cobalt-precorrin 5A hydrolase [Paracoccus pantotrophus]
MRVAGIGFRRAASLASLADALARAGSADALATSPAKADAPVMRALAARTGLPLIAVEVAGIATPTRSPRILARHGTGSLAEAAALAALGPGARITAPRVISQDGMATAAIAEGDPA